MRRLFVAAVILLTLTTISAARAADVVLHPLAYVGADGNVVVISLDHMEAAGIAITTDASGRAVAEFPFYRADRAYEALRWSPDGTSLLFIDRIADALYLTLSGHAPVMIAQGLVDYFPAVWSPDGTRIAYVKAADVLQDGLLRYTIMAWDSTRQTEYPLLDFGFEAACGGVAPDPAQLLYEVETGVGGNGLTLLWTEQGMLHALNCHGTGLALTAFDHHEIWRNTAISRPAIAPDQRRMAGILKDTVNGLPQELVILDLAAGTSTPFISPAPAGIDRLAWIDEGSLLYSTVQSISVLEGIPGTPGASIFPRWPLRAETNQLTVWQVPILTGDTMPLATFQGYRLGTITGVPTIDMADRILIVSVITSLAPLVEQANAGTTADVLPYFVPQRVLYPVRQGANSYGDPAFLALGGHPAVSAIPFEVVTGRP